MPVVGTARPPHVTRVLLLAGGGFTGAFQVPILVDLATRGVHIHYVFGTSVGALNGALFAQGDTDKLEALWAGINDDKPLLGINGFLAPAVQRWRGLYSLAPLEKKVKKLVTCERLRCVFGAGVTVRETGVYRTLTFSGRSYDKKEANWKTRRATDDRALHTAILGSSAIAGLMEPYAATVGGTAVTLSDGGHRHVLPPPPELSREDHPVEVYAVFNRPIAQAALPGMAVDSLPEAFAWAIETQMHAQAMADCDALRAWATAGPPRKLYLYAPTEDAGSLLDASADTLAARMAAGQVAAQKPIVIG